MLELPEVIGVIYPLPESAISRAFKGNKTIFVKFTTHEPTRKTKNRIRNGIKFYFYQSGSGKIIVGDAKISKLEYLQKEDIVVKYKNNLIITESELNNYANGREGKSLLVLHLARLRRYKKPIKLKKSVTMTGQYITQKNKDMLMMQRNTHG